MCLNKKSTRAPRAFATIGTGLLRPHFLLLNSPPFQPDKQTDRALLCVISSNFSPAWMTQTCLAVYSIYHLQEVQHDSEEVIFLQGEYVTEGAFGLRGEYVMA